MNISEFRCDEFSAHRICTEATINIIKEKRLQAGKPRVRIRTGTIDFVFYEMSTPSLGPTQAPIE